MDLANRDDGPELDVQTVLVVARSWDRRARGLIHLRTGDNANWRVRFGGRKWVLRLTREAHRSRGLIEAELDFVEHQAAGGMQVPRLARTATGERIVDAAGLVPGGERLHATMFEHLDGRHFEYHTPDIAAPLFLLWGRTMARLHHLSRSFEERPGFRRPQWRDCPVAGCQGGDETLDRDASRLRDELIAWLGGMRLDPLHYGMVHGDFERSNFVLHDGAIRLFDFDDCCHHWFAWDIACALWAFRNAAAGERKRFLGWFLDGYASIREPDRARLEAFSDLIRLRTISVLLHRSRRGFTLAADRLWAERARAWLRSDWTW